jgi:hypothetical protein
VLEASQVWAKEQIEWQLTAFAKANHNMAVAAILLDALPAPSTYGVGEVYQRLKSILGATAVQQMESSLLHRVKASILPPANPKNGGTEGHPRSSKRGNDFLIGRLLDLRPPRLAECLVGTPNISATSPRG